jgi:hypothetical protein
VKHQKYLWGIIRMTPGQSASAALALSPVLDIAKALEEVNAMEPFYTLLICLPAALVLIACAGGVAALWPSGTHSADPPTVGRRCGGRSSA